MALALMAQDGKNQFATSRNPMEMTDEELMGLSSGAGPRNVDKSSFFASMRPSSAAGMRSGSRPSSAVGRVAGRQLGSRPSSASSIVQDPSKRLGASASATVFGGLRPSSAVEIRAQRKESFHFKRQRRWLEVRSKQHCLSFTEQEMIEFRRFFDALSNNQETLPLDRFEDMLVCVHLANSRKDVRDYLETIQDNVLINNNEITFQDFLKAFESRLVDKERMDVLKHMLVDRYDARDLDLTTFISERRRKLIFEATGARGNAVQGPSGQIVRTFSDLFEDRCYEDFGMGAANKTHSEGLSLMDNLRTMWEVECVQHGLARVLTAEERSANTKKSTPLSPRTIINNTRKVARPKTLGVRRLGRTVIIDADVVEQEAAQVPATGRQAARRNTLVGDTVGLQS